MFGRLLKSIGKGIVKALPLSGFIGDIIDNRSGIKRVAKQIKDKRSVEASDIYLLIDLIDDGTLNESYDKDRFNRLVEIATAVITLVTGAAFLLQ